MIEKIENLIDELKQKHTDQDDYETFLMRFYDKKLDIRLNYRIPFVIADKQTEEEVVNKPIHQLVKKTQKVETQKVKTQKAKTQNAKQKNAPHSHV